MNTFIYLKVYICSLIIMFVLLKDYIGALINRFVLLKVSAYSLREMKAGVESGAYADSVIGNAIVL